MSQKVLFLSTLPSIIVLSGRPCDSPSLLSGWWNPSAGWEEEDDDGCDRLVDVNPPKDAQHMATFIKLLKNRVFLPTVFRTCMYSHVFCVLHGTHVITLHRWGECLKSGLWTSVILKGYYYFQAFNKQKSLGVTEAISEHTHRVNGGHKDKWPGCNFTFASTQTEINEYERLNVSLGSRVAFVFSMLSEQTGKLHLAQECRAHGSPRTLWPPSCRDHLLRTPLWRWWGSRTSRRTPAPHAGWRWGRLFLGPQVHLKQRDGRWVNGYTNEKRFTFKDSKCFIS